MKKKIAVIKLLTQREHHHDTSDVKEIFTNQSFDEKLFWEMVMVHEAEEIVRAKLEQSNLIDLLPVE